MIQIKKWWEAYQKDIKKDLKKLQTIEEVIKQNTQNLRS